MSIIVWLEIQVITHFNGQQSKVTLRYWAMKTKKDIATELRERHINKWLINTSVEGTKYIKYVNSVLGY